MGTFEQANAKFQDWRKKLIAQLHQDNISTHDIKLLLRPPRIEYSTNLSISFISYPVWLAKYDSNNTRGIVVNLNSYREQRRRHVEGVTAQLDEIVGTKIRSMTGTALLDEIGRATHELFILPWIFWDMKGPGELDGDLFLRHGMNQTTLKIDLDNSGPEPTKLLTLDLDGMPDKVNNTTDDDGADVVINYSPYMWDQGRASGTSGIHGAGADKDEVLFHELVHGCRRLNGVPLGRSDVDKGYTSEEEYIAVVISNIYLSERRKKNYRVSHNSFATLPDPEGFLDNAQNINLSPRKLLAEFKRRQLQFYLDLSRIPANRAAFNPVRQHYEEQKAGAARRRP